MEERKLTTRLWKSLARQIERRVSNKANAEDYLSTAYIKMREYQEQKPVQNETAFLKRAARNLAIDDHRSSQVRHRVPICISELVEIRDANPLPDEVLIVHERLALVRARLMELHPRTREIFLMHRLDGIRHREIAEKMGISVSAVEKHIAKAVLHISRMSTA